MTYYSILHKLKYTATRFFFYKQLHFWVQPGVAKAFLQFQPQSCLMVASSVQISAYSCLRVACVEDGWVFSISLKD